MTSKPTLWRWLTSPLVQSNFKRASSALHPGQTAEILSQAGEAIGWLGMLHPMLEKRLGFDSPYFIRLNQDVLLNRKIPVFAALSKFPSVRRDMALIVEDEVTSDSILACIKGCDEPTLQDICIFDVYRGLALLKEQKCGIEFDLTKFFADP